MDFNEALQKIELDAIFEGVEKHIKFKDDAELDKITQDLDARAKKRRKQVIVTKTGKNTAKVAAITATDSAKAMRTATQIASGLGI